MTVVIEFCRTRITDKETAMADDFREFAASSNGDGWLLSLAAAQRNMFVSKFAMAQIDRLSCKQFLDGPMAVFAIGLIAHFPLFSVG
jgi:hypothetical protein